MNKDGEISLELENIEKNYGDQAVLKHVDLRLHKGELNTIFGISGSGKSTLLKIISGIEEMDRGKVLFEGVDISTLATEERNIGFVFQKPLLFPHMTVEENIAFSLKVKGVKSSIKKRKVSEMLVLMGIEALKDRYPNELSGGQQQRVAIGRALASDPKLLLLDEPFNGFDQKLRYDMGILIKELQKSLKLTIVFVTHDVDECLRLSDRIAILSEGKVLQHDQSNLVYYQPVNAKVAELMGPGNWLHGQVKKGVFTCSLGLVKASEYDDGHYLLFVRPHQIELTKNTDGTAFEVKTVERIGKIQRITCEVSTESIIIERMYVLEKHIDLSAFKLSINMPHVVLRQSLL